MRQRAVRETAPAKLTERASCGVRFFFSDTAPLARTEVALGAEGGFIALPAAPGRLEGREHTFLG